MPTQSPTPRFSLESASVYALLATLILAVFVFIPFPGVPFLSTKFFLLAAGAVLTLALFILARLARGNVILPPALPVALLWLPAIAYALSSVFSGIPFPEAFWGTLGADTFAFMLVAAVLGTLTALTVRRAGQYRLFLAVAGYALGALAALQILILIVGQFAPAVISPTLSVVGSYGDLAAFMGLTLIGVLLGLRFLEVGARVEKLLYALGAAALFLLAVANSEIVWILVALTSLGLFVEAVMRRRTVIEEEIDVSNAALIEEYVTEEPSGRPLVAPLVALAAALFFLIGGTLGGALANAFHVNVLSVRPSWQSTVAVTRDIYASAPFFGSGPGTFGAEWLLHRDASLNSTVFWNIDFTSGIGFIPTSAATTGIVGAFAWLAFLALLVFFGGRALIARASEDAFMRFAMLLSFTAAVYLFAIGLLSLPGVVVLALAFVAAGLFVSSMRYAAGGGQWGIAFARAPRTGFIIVFGLTLLLLASVAAAYTLVGQYVASVFVARASAALAAGDLDGASSAAQSALAFAPLSNAYRVEAAVALTRMNRIAASSTLSATDAQKAFQTALSGGINAALTATQVNGNDYQNWLALGNLYAQAVPLKVKGAYESAKTAYARAAALHPTSPQIPYVVAQLDIANGDAKSAEKDLQDAITLKQDYTAAILLLSQLYVRDGNVKDALSSAEAAAYFTPNDSATLVQVGILRAASGDLGGAAQALSAAVSVNPQFANARYFLAAVYAKQKDFTDAAAQLTAIAGLSSDNAKAVESQLAALKSGKDPFPANLLTVSPATGS